LRRRAWVVYQRGVFVNLAHRRVGRDALCPLVTFVLGGDAGAEAQKLADTGLASKVPPRPAQEGPVGLDAGDDPREHRHDLLGGLPVGSEVILAPQPVVVDPRRIRHARIEAGWRLPARPVSPLFLRSTPLGAESALTTLQPSL